MWANESEVSGPREAVIPPVVILTFGYQSFAWFADKDYARDRRMGLLDIWDQPKAAYFTYNTAIKMFRNTRPLSRLEELGLGLIGYPFRKGH